MRRTDRGASLVEFALLVPLLFSILLGTITGGLALSTKNSLTNAVREGARLGATLPASDWDAWAVSVKDRVRELAGSDLDDADVCVAMMVAGEADPIGEYPASGCDLELLRPAMPDGATAGDCVVMVWAHREATLNALFFSRDLDLEGQAVGLYERDGCP